MPMDSKPAALRGSKTRMQQRRQQQAGGVAAMVGKAALALLLLALHTTTAFLPAGPGPSSSSSNSALLPRQHTQPRVAPAAAAAKGKGYGRSSGGSSSGNSGPVAVDGRSLRGYSKVLEEGAGLGAAKDSQKAVGPFKVGSEEKFLLLVRRDKGKVAALDANCGRCKFPLLNGKVLVDASIDDSEPQGEDKEVISCPLCAVTHSLADGRVTGAQASGVLQKVSASFFSKQIATGIKAYEATATEDGAVFAKLR